MLEFQVENQPLDALPLQGEVPTRPAAAANDGQPALLGAEPRLILANVDERTNHDVLAVVGDEPCRHRLERSREKEIQQERLNEVVQVVAERNLGRAHLGGDTVQDAAPQARAQRTGCGVGFEQIVHHLADRRVLDAVLPATLAAGVRNDVVLEVFVAGVDVDRDEREIDRSPMAQLVERLYQRPAVLAAREADHDAVAVLNQVEIDDGFGGLPGDTGFERAAVRHSYDIRASVTQGAACGDSDAVYAPSATKSSAVSFSTTGFMSCAQTPFRVPICMSYSWRTR